MRTRPETAYLHTRPITLRVVECNYPKDVQALMACPRAAPFAALWDVDECQMLACARRLASQSFRSCRLVMLTSAKRLDLRRATHVAMPRPTRREVENMVGGVVPPAVIQQCRGDLRMIMRWSRDAVPYTPCTPACTQGPGETQSLPRVSLIDTHDVRMSYLVCADLMPGCIGQELARLARDAAFSTFRAGVAASRRCRTGADDRRFPSDGR